MNDAGQWYAGHLRNDKQRGVIWLRLHAVVGQHLSIHSVIMVKYHRRISTIQIKGDQSEGSPQSLCVVLTPAIPVVLNNCAVLLCHKGSLVILTFAFIIRQLCRQPGSLNGRYRLSNGSGRLDNEVWTIMT